VIFFIVQSTLVRTHNVRLHRQVGWLGVALGAAIPVLGVSTAVTMARFNILHLHSTDAPADLIVPLFDMVAFTVSFVLAISWRRRPEFHRRLLLIASCALTAAAFGRFPPNLLPPVIFYAGVDVLIVLGAVRDWIVERRIHQVYLWAIPALMVGQIVVVYTGVHHLPYWLRIAEALLR
jgi:hypothetical protein